jgi:hypothetical protein
MIRGRRQCPVFFYIFRRRNEKTRQQKRKDETTGEAVTFIAQLPFPLSSFEEEGRGGGGAKE